MESIHVINNFVPRSVFAKMLIAITFALVLALGGGAWLTLSITRPLDEVVLNLTGATQENSGGHDDARYGRASKPRQYRKPRRLPMRSRRSHNRQPNAPTEALEGRTPACSQRLPRANEVILTAMVGMMDHAARAALAEGHVERLEDQLGTQRGLDRPTHDAPAEHIEHYG